MLRIGDPTENCVSRIIGSASKMHQNHLTHNGSFSGPVDNASKEIREAKKWFQSPPLLTPSGKGT